MSLSAHAELEPCEAEAGADASRRRLVGAGLLAAVVVGVGGTVVLRWLWRRGYWGIVGEDRLAEWATFACYLVVVLLATVLALRLRRQGRPPDALVMVAIAAAAVLVAGEEVSWFQRQVGFQGPDVLVARNNQGEANVHNLLGQYPLHGAFIVAGLTGAIFARLLVPRLPVLRERPWLYVPSRSLVWWFGIAPLYYVWLDYLNPLLVAAFGDSVDTYHLTGPKLQEVVEMFLAGALTLHLLPLVTAPGPVASIPPPAWSAAA